MEEKQQSLESILIQRILVSPELRLFIEQIAEQKFRDLNIGQKLTCEDVMAEWQLSKTTVRTLTDEQLNEMGLRKVKGGAWVRFHRIAMVDASREKFNRIKKSIR